MTYEILIAIVARNGLKMTKRAVGSAMRQITQSGDDISVLLVDNASNDGTMSWARTKPGLAWELMCPQVSLSSCWNQSIHIALRAKYDRVLICNNDIQLRLDTALLLAQCDHDFVSCVSVDAVDRMGVEGDRTAEELMSKARPHPDYSCFMVKPEMIRKNNLWFNEAYYPAYCEDADHHVRMHRAGIKALCVDLPFLHLGSGTLKDADPAEADRIRRGADANRERFCLTYGCLPGTPEYAKLFL